MKIEGSDTKTVDSLNESVAKAIRMHRNCTQVELALRSGYSQFKISRIEGGKQSINVEELKVICDAIGVEPHKIVMYAEDMIKNPSL